MRRRRFELQARVASRMTVGYVRVSTDEQAREGVSLQAQEARIRAFCEATGRRLERVIVEAAITAKHTDRPGLREIQAGVRSRQIGAVVVLKIDRATRSVRDLADLIDFFGKYECAFVSVNESIDTGSAAGRMITNLFGVLAQFEREQIGERTAFALSHKRKERLIYGHAPFGWTREQNRLIPVEAEQLALAAIRKMDADGISYRKIGAWLDRNGFVPRQGGQQWHAASVRKMLLSRMFTETV